MSNKILPLDFDHSLFYSYLARGTQSCAALTGEPLPYGLRIGLENGRHVIVRPSRYLVEEGNGE